MILVDPRIRFNYATYYIKGVEDLLGEKVQFSTEPFQNLRCEKWYEYFSGVPMIVDGKKVFIDYCDYEFIVEDRYEWCDIYAKVNCTEEQLKEHTKLMAIGPGFGIQLYSPMKTLWKGWRTYQACKGHMSISNREFFGNYGYSFIRRRKLERYEQGGEEVDKNYVFHASVLWNKKLQDQTTNAQRAAFLKICKETGLQVDGGLVYLKDSGGELKNYAKYKTKYKDFLIEKRINPDEYIEKTKRSLCVFNAPSVGMCHGWKLAEYLCMGKAIISVPLTRALPTPIEGLRIVNNPAELKEAIEEIRSIDALRKDMEQASREYYKKWLAPKAVMKHVLQATN